MKISHREWPVLIGGDVFAFILALYITLTVRYVAIPSWELYVQHLIPFSFLFLLSVTIFYIAGLYEKHTSLFKRELPNTVLTAQTINVVFAAVFFFFIPYFGIEPKTNLVLYLIISSTFVVVLRLVVFPRFLSKKREPAIIIGTGKEFEEVLAEAQANPRYGLDFIDSIDTSRIQNANDIQGIVLKQVIGNGVRTVVASTHGKYGEILVPLFYNLTFVQARVEIINLPKIYEEMFDKIALSQLSHEWLLENLESERQLPYAIAKRSIDIVASFCILVALCFITPLVYVAMRIEGPGDVFIKQERVGKNGKPITVYKFRSMTSNENGAWVGETKNRVTKVGAFLRKTSIDELPQVFAILRGELSFIGPRSDITGLADRLADAIPFYNVRYRVVPGISGWAQINQRYTPGNISPQSIEESRIRLAYDLYYVKHRSFLLDMSIALRTIKTLITRLIPSTKHGSA